MRINTSNAAGHLPDHRYRAHRTAADHKAAAAVAYDDEAFSACGSHDDWSNCVRANPIREERVTLSGERERGRFGLGSGGWSQSFAGQVEPVRLSGTRDSKDSLEHTPRYTTVCYSMGWHCSLWPACMYVSAHHLCQISKSTRTWACSDRSDRLYCSPMPAVAMHLGYVSARADVECI